MRHLAPLALLFISGTALATGDFARLAPPDAGLVINLADYARAKAQLVATPLGRLIEQPEIAHLIEDARTAQMASFDKLTDELGIDVEEWPEPAGMVGFALIMRPIEHDEWSPAFQPTFVSAIDFGDGIVEIQRIVEAVVDKGLDQGLIEIQTDTVGQVEVISITSVPIDQGDDAPQPGDPLYEPPTGLRAMLSGLQNATIAISDSTFYVGSDKDQVMDMLDRARGTDLPAIADDDRFNAALAQHPEGTTDYVVAMPGQLGLIESFASGMGLLMPPGLDITQILTNLGITGMKAISVSANLESPDAQAEFTLGVLDPEKTGLVSLLDITDEPWDPPSFVTPDAIAATRLLIDFPRLPEVVREFFTTLPLELQDELSMPFEQVMALVEPVAPLLGPEVYIVQTLERPFQPESAGQLFAIPTTDEMPLSNILLVASGGALTSRDFGATKIYDDSTGAVSVAVAYSTLFVGTPTMVESALRLAAADAADDLSDEPAFQDAMRPLPSTGNALQFTRTLSILDFTLWAAQHAQDIAAQQLRAAGYSEEEVAQYVQSGTTPEWAKSITIDTLARGVGDISMEIAPSPDGFRGRILLHPPR